MCGTPVLVEGGYMGGTPVLIEGGYMGGLTHYSRSIQVDESYHVPNLVINKIDQHIFREYFAAFYRRMPQFGAFASFIFHQ